MPGSIPRLFPRSSTDCSRISGIQVGAEYQTAGFAHAEFQW
jgi:hypothetical protein